MTERNQERLVYIIWIVFVGVVVKLSYSLQRSIIADVIKENVKQEYLK